MIPQAGDCDGPDICGETVCRSAGIAREHRLDSPCGRRFGRSRPVASPQSQSSKVLVAYFTRTGNTRVIARQIQRALRADLFEIEPAEPYPEDYEETVAQAVRERDSGYRPPLKASVPNIGLYEVVFLGFPIWGETAPPVIRSFLSQHDLSGKTLVPFITHGGYGQGREHERCERARAARVRSQSIRAGSRSGEADAHASLAMAERRQHSH